MRRAANVDANQTEIVKALRAVGVYVQSLAACGDGVPTRTGPQLAAARRNLRFAIKVNSERQYPVWVCAQCGCEKPGTSHQRRQRYCSRECMAQAYAVRMVGGANPNFSDAGKCQCEHCGAEYRNYNKERRFCSLPCRDRGNDQLRTNAKKDANHDVIVEVLTKGGAFVRDLSRAMFGVPDLLVWHRERWHLIEVKNPKTGYGRKGLNKAQSAWAKDWCGGPIYVVRTVDDAAAFLGGTLQAVSKEGLSA